MPADIEGRLAGLRTFDYLPGLPNPADLRHAAERRHRRRQALTAGVVAAILMVVVAIVMLPHRASPKPLVPPTGPTGGVVLVTGRITVDGRPVTFASVTAEIWPNSALLATMPASARVPILAVSTPDDATGRYRITLDPAAVSPNYWEEGGLVNVDFTVDADDLGGAEWNEPILRCGAIWCNGAGTPPTLDFDLGRDPTVTQDGGSPLPLPR